MPGPEGDGPRGWSAGGSARQSAPWAPQRGQPGTAASQAGSGPGRAPLPSSLTPTRLCSLRRGGSPAFPGRSTTGPGARAPDPRARPREEEEAREPGASPVGALPGAGARRGEEPTAQGRGPDAASQVRPARRPQARSYLSAAALPAGT